MKGTRIAKVVWVAAAAFFWLARPFPAGAAEVKPEEAVARHLESLGDAKALADAKTRVAEGTVQYKILVGGSGNLDGKSVLVSDGRKFQFMLKFTNNDYRGERYICDGDKIQVASATPALTRSGLGHFIYIHDAVVREGLLGGTLSTAWPLLHLDERKAKLSYEGLKTIEGQQLHDLRYRPRKNSDLDIHLYFDSETFRHVRTVYTFTVRPGLGYRDATAPVDLGGSNPNAIPPESQRESSETQTARQQETRYRLEERFSEFKTVDGLTLPMHHNIHFTQELKNGRTSLSEWDITESNVMHNVSLDPRNFQVR